MSSQYWYYLLDRIIGLEKHERITEDAQTRMLKEAVQTSYRRGGEETTQTETAEISKTAPKPSQKAGEKPAKTWQKVAEITINLKTVKKIRLLLKRIDSLVG